MREVLKISSTSAQLQYILLFCFWMLSFEPSIAARFKFVLLVRVLLAPLNFFLFIFRDYDLVVLIVRICADAIKEKVIRLCISIIRNLIEKAPHVNVSIFIGAKTLELLTSLSVRKFSDQEISQDVQYVKDELTAVYQTLRYIIMCR